MVERCPDKTEVEGPIPSSPTFSFLFSLPFISDSLDINDTFGLNENLFHFISFLTSVYKTEVEGPIPSAHTTIYTFFTFFSCCKEY